MGIAVSPSGQCQAYLPYGQEGVLVQAIRVPRSAGGGQIATVGYDGHGGRPRAECGAGFHRQETTDANSARAMHALALNRR
jgi:hypothetical protein